MVRHHKKYLVAGAVLSFVIAFTSATVVADTICTPSTGTECNVIPNSVCENSKCKCKAEYKEDPAGTCAIRALGSQCTAGADAECAGVTHAVCKPTDNICACVGAYKQANAACVAKGHDDSCTDNAHCAGVANSECSAEAPRKCACKTGFTPINNVCKRGLGNPCTDDASCSAVSNAECPTATKKCTCKANYNEDNGYCSTANGLQTLLSAPVALLLSFLTIVVTRLN